MRLPAPALAAGVLAACLVAAVASIVTAEGPNDFSFITDVSVTNNSTTTDWFGPMPVDMNSTNLVNGGFLDATGTEALFTNSANTKVAGVNQDISMATSTWWWFTDVKAEQTGTVRVFTLGTTSSHSFPFGGLNDRIEVQDHPSLDIVDDLTVEATLTLAELPNVASTTYVVNKAGAYQLGVSSSTELFAAVGGGASTTVNILATSTATSTFSQNGCATNHLCIDDPVGAPDDMQSDLLTNSATYVADTYELEDTPPAAFITSVGITWRSHESSGDGRVTACLVLSSVESCAPEQAVTTSWVTYHDDNIARPGGGSWTAGDVAGLQLRMKMHNNGAVNVRLTQAYVRLVSKTAEVQVTHSPPLVVGTEYALRMVYYDPGLLELYVDGVLEASTSSDGLIASTSTAVDIGRGITGGLDDVRIGHTSTTSPTFVLHQQYEPHQLTQTQHGDPSNGWEWQGTSTDALGASNNGTYHLTADPTQLTIAVQGLTVPAGAPLGSATQTPIGLLPAPSLAIFTSPQATISSPFLDPIRDASVGGALPATAWWLLLSTIFGAVVTGRTFKAWPSFGLNAILAGLIYFIVALISGVNFMTIVFLYGVWAFGAILISQYLKAG